eukprot:CAMPEP_0194336548 /NCGR_PEP_ID=MMETSP0171-20130528/73313_1 /TAXON_ID=218684 /ORGANISM="Corethron pennatum, Strain L29A3" /LENGTH=92 /DNA_ID=CAMNT_0039100039 /DNA_START=631 /DNA_END=909 /DNA_ORIENTATION=-
MTNSSYNVLDRVCEVAFLWKTVDTSVLAALTTHGLSQQDRGTLPPTLPRSARMAAWLLLHSVSCRACAGALFFLPVLEMSLDHDPLCGGGAV